MKILHVDDEEDFLEIAKVFLTKEDERFNVTSTTSARDALNLLREEEYDIVISDYAMPEMDGLQLLEIIRRETDIPFILLTGKGREEVAIRALNLGADRYMQKSHDVQTQYQMLARVIVQEANRYQAEREQRKAELKLAESEREKAAILDSSPFHILLQDLDHRIIWANRSAAESVGETAERLQGKRCYEIWADRETPCEVCPVRKSRIEGKPESGERETPDGRWWLVAGAPVKDENGITVGAVEITLDTTEQKQTERRREFLHSLLTHDVGNSIQVVQAALEILKNTDLTAEQSEILNKALIGLERQQDIIERVRLLRDVEREKDLESIDIVPVVRSVISESNLRQFGEGMSVRTSLPEQELMVQGGKLLKPLLSNLIENSLEHSDGTEIRLTAQTHESNIIITLQDDGKGIPQGIIEDILNSGFEPETRGSPGLGLFLVKEIVRSYGGRIEIRNSEMGGTRIDIHLRKAGS